jgi:acetate kinase
MLSPCHVLALNSGSSSVKFGLFRVAPERCETLCAGTMADADPTAAMAGVVSALAQPGLPAPDAIGHRVVHGGPTLRRHGLIDAALLHQLDAAVAFAPLHIPAALALIRWAGAHFRGIPQVACFDTCFHNTMPDVARVLPLDRALQAQGIERYGFHGLSLESIVRQLGERQSGERQSGERQSGERQSGERQSGEHQPRRLVVAHLGNGASITAIEDGRSIDTSMGLTPSGGVIMGTRSGDLDPGVLVYLVRERQFDAAMLEDMVDRRSGLLGISGLSGDMRRLHEAAASNADAALAIDMFCCAVRKHIAAMGAVLGGIDMLVFTGGIGENDALVRDKICAGLGWLGVGPRNVRVVSSREEEQIARHAAALSPDRASAP